MTDLSTLPNILTLSDDQINDVITRMRDTGWESLEPKKRAFAIAYVESYNKQQAASTVDIANETANKYLRDPLVLALISDLQQNLMKMNVVTEDFIRQKYLQLLPITMGEEQAKHIIKGEVVEDFIATPANAVAILKELGKHTEGFYKDNKSKGNGSVNITIDMGALMGESHVVIEGQTEDE